MTSIELKVLRNLERGIINLTKAAELLTEPGAKKVTRGGAAYRLLMAHVRQVRRAKQ